MINWPFRRVAGWVLLSMSSIYNMGGEAFGWSERDTPHVAVGWFMPAVLGCFILISAQIDRALKKPKGGK